VAERATLIVEVPAGSAVEAQLRGGAVQAVTDGSAVVEAGPTDKHGRLEPETAGQIVLSLPSAEALERDPDSVRQVVGHAGSGSEPLVVVIEVADELRESELAVAVQAAAHASRPVILRVNRGS
jgi:hypothetical protein